MEKLSTECLKGLRDRIDSILEERIIEENEMDEIISSDSEPVSFEERRKLYLDKFEAYIEEFNKLFPLFIEEKRRWLTSDTVGEHGGYINAVSGFSSFNWNDFMQRLEDNKIFISHVYV